MLSKNVSLFCYTLLAFSRKSFKIDTILENIFYSKHYCRFLEKAREEQQKKSHFYYTNVVKKCESILLHPPSLLEKSFQNSTFSLPVGVGGISWKKEKRKKSMMNVLDKKRYYYFTIVFLIKNLWNFFSFIFSMNNIFLFILQEHQSFQNIVFLFPA